MVVSLSASALSPRSPGRKAQASFDCPRGAAYGSPVGAPSSTASQDGPATSESQATWAVRIRNSDLCKSNLRWSRC